MNGSSSTATREPILRTLAPSLRNLAEEIARILETQRYHPLDVIQRAGLEGIVADLRRKAQDLSEQEPLLVIMLMGGTGVGKSTLLNALARAEIATAAATRPTTRDPVVYLHESVRVERLDPALRACRLQRHQREELRQKVVVDTPDLDSTELANRERLSAIMPVADIVLYAGSQEKYHDRLGWAMFCQQRRRRGFAFVLNKWDRCQHPGATGSRPDEDLLRDLKREGFENPLLFRTCAQLWLTCKDGKPPPNLPEGDEFLKLVEWLETGLSRLEIEAVKSRGVVQLLDDLDQQLSRAMPPDLTSPARGVSSGWTKILHDEADQDSDVLVNALAPSQPEIERHFARRVRQQFTGPYRWFLGALDVLNDPGYYLRAIVIRVKKPEDQHSATESLDLSGLIRECIRIGRERSLDQRLLALGNHLLIEAERLGFPARLLNDSVAGVGKLDWSQRLESAVRDAFRLAEQVCVRPSSARRWSQTIIVMFVNWAPWVAFVGGYLVVMYRFYVDRLPPNLVELIAPVIFTLIILIVLDGIVRWILPVRWHTIRGEFQRLLRDQLEQNFHHAYMTIPTRAAEVILHERRQMEDLQAQVRKVREWLQARDQSTRVAALYGTETNR